MRSRKCEVMTEHQWTVATGANADQTSVVEVGSFRLKNFFQHSADPQFDFQCVGCGIDVTWYLSGAWSAPTIRPRRQKKCRHDKSGWSSELTEAFELLSFLLKSKTINMVKP